MDTCNNLLNVIHIFISDQSEAHYHIRNSTKGASAQEGNSGRDNFPVGFHVWTVPFAMNFFQKHLGPDGKSKKPSTTTSSQGLKEQQSKKVVRTSNLRNVSIKTYLKWGTSRQRRNSICYLVVFCRFHFLSQSRVLMRQMMMCSNLSCPSLSLEKRRQIWQVTKFKGLHGY